MSQPDESISTRSAAGGGVLLDARDITVRYGGAVAVNSCSLTLGWGEAVCVLGRNGAGKSSLLSALARVTSSEGEVEFGGRRLVAGKAHKASAAGFVMVPEGRQLFAGMTVEDNLLLGSFPWCRRITRARASKEIEHVYGLFPRLSERSRQDVGTLSGGEQQMVAIGRAIMGRPTLLVLDEPSLGLSASMINTTYAALRQLREEGVSMLITEESPRRALELCDRGLVLAAGRVIHEGSAAELREPGRLENLYLA